MAQHDFLKLASQGRAFDATRAWTEDELLAVEALVAHGLERTVAAEYVRNGIKSVALYEASKAAGLEPKSLEVLRTEAVAEHQKKVLETLSDLKVSEPEVVVEKEVVEPEVETVSKETVEPEVVEETPVSEPEVVPEEDVEPKAEKGNKRGGKNK